MFSSAFVYLYSFAVVVVAVIVARHAREEQLSGQRFAARLLLVFYLGCILALTFSPQPSPGSAIASVPVDLEITPILVPFRTISDMLRYRLVSEIMINLVGNIVVFVPFGILMALVYPGLATWRRIAMAGALFSLGIELGQLGVSLSFKQRFCLILNFLLPMPDRNRMNTVSWPISLIVFTPRNASRATFALTSGVWNFLFLDSLIFSRSL